MFHVCLVCFFQDWPRVHSNLRSHFQPLTLKANQCFYLLLICHLVNWSNSWSINAIILWFSFWFHFYLCPHFMVLPSYTVSQTIYTQWSIWDVWTTQCLFLVLDFWPCLLWDVPFETTFWFWCLIFSLIPQGSSWSKLWLPSRKLLRFPIALASLVHLLFNLALFWVTLRNPF
jgi:hypothetical protein